MTEITLYNTRTRSKEPLAPARPDNVRMYVCGPTVYDCAHIGNARPVVVFDVLFRLLRHVYGDGARDLRAQHHRRGRQDQRAGRRDGPPIREITEETAAWYREDMAAPRRLAPDLRAARDRVHRADDRHDRDAGRAGHAYAAEGHVLFSVASYPDYGKLRPAARSTRCAPAPGSRWRPTSATRWTSCCGSPPTDASPAGRAPGAGAAPAGTSSARRCPTSSSALVRHPRRRHRPGVPPPRERDRPVGLRPP